MHHKLNCMLMLAALCIFCSCTVKDKTPAAVDDTAGTTRTSLADTLQEDTTKTMVATTKGNEPAYTMTGAIHTATGQYIDLDENFDDVQLIVAIGSDTIWYICPDCKDLKLSRGDSIRVFWKNGMLRPAGDPDFPAKAIFAVNHELISPGKLAIALKKGMPRINYYYYTEATSDYLKDIIHTTMKYYLANTTQPAVREELDQHKRNLLYTVERDTINGKEVATIVIHIDGSKPQPIHTVYFEYERPYNFQEKP